MSKNKLVHLIFSTVQDGVVILIHLIEEKIKVKGRQFIKKKYSKLVTA